MRVSIIAFANLMNILSFLLLSPALRGLGAAPTTALAVSLISRLMLNIRDPKYTQQQFKLSALESIPLTDQSQDTAAAGPSHERRAQEALGMAAYHLLDSL
jgi:hypothetical protein